MQTHTVLKKYFNRKKKSTHGFSIRSLAAKLGVSPSFLSRIFSGDRTIPFPLLIKLGHALEMEAETFNALKAAHSYAVGENHVPKRGTAKIKTQTELWEKSEDSNFEILRQWFYVAILDIVNLSNFDGTIGQIARRLGIAESTVEVATRELVSAGLLRLENDRLVKIQTHVRLASPKKLDLVRRFHSQMLAKAQDELKNATSEEAFQKRLITGITLSIPESKIPYAKSRLSEFLHELANELTQSPGEEVYQLAAQLFPLTKGK